MENEDKYIVAESDVKLNIETSEPKICKKGSENIIEINKNLNLLTEIKRCDIS